jgi:HEAT repeat protein
MFLEMRCKSFLPALGVFFLLTPATALPAEPPVSELIRTAKSGNEPARIKAIDELGARGDKASAAVEPLTKLLHDNSGKVRAHAVRSLGQIGPAAKPAATAISNLLKDSDATVRRQAVTALGGIRPGPDVMVPLVVKLLQDSDPAVQMRILQTVSEAGPAAMPGLLKALQNEKAAYWACLVLRDMGPAGKEAVPALAEKLKDPRPEVRQEAALALGAMPAAAVSVLPQIAAVIDDEHACVAATFALGQIGQIPASVETKIRSNANSDDKFLSTVSSWTLARAHPTDKELLREAAERLVGRITDEDPFVRVAAARALAALPPAPEITVPLFERALQNADETTTHYALDALASLGAPAVPRLIEVLKHKKLRSQASYILGETGPAAAPATESLAQLVKDDDLQVATEAIIALSKIGPGARRAVPALLRALQHEDCPNGRGIIYALGKIGPAAMAAEPRLLELMKGKDTSLAITSAWAITQLHPQSSEFAAKALPVLTAGLGDPLPESRQAAADLLGSVGPLAQTAIPALQTATRDENQSVRDSAAEAIRRIRGEIAK